MENQGFLTVIRSAKAIFGVDEAAVAVVYSSLLVVYRGL